MRFGTAARFKYGPQGQPYTISYTTGSHFEAVVLAVFVPHLFSESTKRSKDTVNVWISALWHIQIISKIRCAWRPQVLFEILSAYGTCGLSLGFELGSPVALSLVHFPDLICSQGIRPSLSAESGVGPSFVTQHITWRLANQPF